MLLVLIGTVAMLLFSAKSYTISDQELRSTNFFSRVITDLESDDVILSSQLSNETLHILIGGTDKTNSMAAKFTLANFENSSEVIKTVYFNEEVYKLYEPLSGIRKTRYKEVHRSYYLYLDDMQKNAKLDAVFVYRVS
jgi:hypothetical protein